MNTSTSKIPIAIDISIAAITLIGSKVKRLLNARRQMSNTNNEAIPSDHLDLAPLCILSEVLTNTAVTGSPPIIPDQILAIAFQKISLSLENDDFVIFSAAFPEIMVSKIVITATIIEVFITSNASILLCHNWLNHDKYPKSHKEKFRDGYLSIKSGIAGNHHCCTMYPTPIPSNETIIVPGIFDFIFFSIKIMSIPIPAVIKGTHCVSVTCKHTSRILR